MDDDRTTRIAGITFDLGRELPSSSRGTCRRVSEDGVLGWNEASREMKPSIRPIFFYEAFIMA